MAFEFTDANFAETVTDAKGIQVVDFWAEWCGPCKMITPYIEEFAEKYKEQATIGKLNVDDNGTTSFKYKVRSIPTILFFKDGELVDKITGAPSKQNLEAKIQEHL